MLFYLILQFLELRFELCVELVQLRFELVLRVFVIEKFYRNLANLWWGNPLTGVKMQSHRQSQTITRAQ